jgi:hypothetical protein
MEEAGGLAQGYEASLHRLEHAGDIMAARFHDKVSKCSPCMETSSCDADCAVGEQQQLAHFGLSAVM